MRVRAGIPAISTVVRYWSKGNHPRFTTSRLSAPIPLGSGLLPLVSVVASVFLTIAASGPAQARLSFNLTDGSGLTTLQSTNLALYNQVRGGFNSAAALWSTTFSDPITVNITIDYQALGSGILGSTSNSFLQGGYSALRSQLASDANPLSAVDTAAIASLPVSNPTYIANAGVTVNSANVVVTKANLKAMGVTGLDATFGAQDAAITFSSNFAFDFDRSNGIASNQFDFIGIAAHEIGHSLGFVSAVDNGGTSLTPDVLDLFRFSATSTLSSARDLTVNNQDKYFSVNGGFSDINGGAIDVLFSNGVSTSDGQQASHWKDNRNIGIMDPTAAPGELLAISANDRNAFDAIGWNLFASTVPEPGSLALLFTVGLPLVGVIRRVRRRKP